MGLLNAVVEADQLLPTAYEFARRMTANAPLAVQATKQSALQGLYFDEDLAEQLKAAVRALQKVGADGADPAAAAAVLEQLGKELRGPFGKESRMSSKIFQTEDAKEGPKAFAEKRAPNWQAR
jgi:enoyl-CoA hydratase